MPIAIITKEEELSKLMGDVDDRRLLGCGSEIGARIVGEYKKEPTNYYTIAGLLLQIRSPEAPLAFSSFHVATADSYIFEKVYNDVVNHLPKTPVTEEFRARMTAEVFSGSEPRRCFDTDAKSFFPSSCSPVSSRRAVGAEHLK